MSLRETIEQERGIDLARTIDLCNELSAEVRRLKRERSALRASMRWLIARLQNVAPSVYIPADWIAFVSRGRHGH